LDALKTRLDEDQIMATDNSLPKEADDFRWSFDEIRNLFVKARVSGERPSSTGSFHLSLSGTWDAIRARFSSNKSLSASQQETRTTKKLRVSEEETKVERRENRRESRKGKSEKEKDRRNNVNNLFYKLGDLLGMEAGVKNKSQILANAKDFLGQPDTSGSSRS